MIEFDFRGNDPHHYYHITVRDKAQADRVVAHIRQRIAARDPDLVRAPAIDGARISTVRRAPIRGRGVATPGRQPRSAPSARASSTSNDRIRMLAIEGSKRGLVDNLGSDVDAALYPHLGNIPATVIGTIFPRERVATGLTSPMLSDYMRIAAERLGYLHPEIRADGFIEHVALDGSRGLVASISPPGGTAVGARVASSALMGARRAVLPIARRALERAASISSGTGLSVVGGEIAERLGFPRAYGALPGALVGGASPLVVARAYENLRRGRRAFSGGVRQPPAESGPVPGLKKETPSGERPHSDSGGVYTYAHDRENAGLVLKDGVPVEMPSGRYYPVMYRTFLDPATTPRHRTTQSRRVAKEMHELALANPEWGAEWEAFSPGALERMSAKGGRKLPKFWVDHHPPAQPWVPRDPVPLGTVEVTPYWMHNDPRFRLAYHGESNRGGFADLPPNPPRRR